jgi:hypothetical protein
MATVNIDEPSIQSALSSLTTTWLSAGPADDRANLRSFQRMYARLVKCYGTTFHVEHPILLLADRGLHGCAKGIITLDYHV